MTKTDEHGKHAANFGRERAFSYEDHVRRFWAGSGVMQDPSSAPDCTTE